MPLACQHVVIPAGHTVVVAAGVQAYGLTLDVSLNSQLTLELTATMDIENP